MSLTNDIRNTRNPLNFEHDVIYEDDGFFSDVPISGSLSRSMLALNKYVKKNLLCDENGEYEESDDIAYFSKESSPNDSVIKRDTESIKSNYSDEKIEEVKSELVSTLVFSSKVLSEPVSESIYDSDQTGDCNSIQLFDLQKAKDEGDNGDFNFVEHNRYHYVSEYKPEFESPALTDDQSSNYAPDKDHYNIRTVTNTVVRIAYSDYRSQSEFDSQDIDNSISISQKKLQPNYSDIVTTVVKLVEENNNKSSLKYDTTTSGLGQRQSLNGRNYQPDLESDSHKYLTINNSSQRGNSDFLKERAELNDCSSNLSDTRYEQEPTHSLSEYFISKSETGSENGDPETVVRRENRYSPQKQENRHTIHDFTEWGNRTNIYPDVYAPLPYKSPRRYVESDVNIHYRCPVRHDPLPLVPERELARQQAEHMKRLYREQRRTKYLQELQDMQNRRHQDNFTPSQKTVVPLNRYDEADKVTAKALYTFNGQTPRELSFRKGEIIHVRRQIDANWYEGEVHGKIGLFPYNYVEIQKSDTIQAPKKLTTIEGRARAKFDFIAQTNLELPLKKGEVVVLTRRIDQNWWEGRNGVRTGIFPDSYVTVLQEPTQNKPEPKPILSTDKPVASPAAHGLLNGTDKRSMGSHSYTPQPNSPALANAPPATQPLPGYAAKPAQATLTPSDRGYGPPTGPGVDLNNAEPLYVDTNAEAVPYRAMYKYRPQNPDELELQEGDTVYVLEKCDDGWYVGSSQRTGRFGTFPGNYVERI